ILMIGGIHGNEQAGVKALEYLIKMLEVEHITNEVFRFTGRLIALKGNVQALQANQRYLHRDLNRMFRTDLINSLLSKSIRTGEERELVEITDFVQQCISDYQPETIYLLDLHTTTATGGIFTIVNDSPEALKIGLELKAPVIEGF